MEVNEKAYSLIDERGENLKYFTTCPKDFYRVIKLFKAEILQEAHEKGDDIDPSRALLGWEVRVHPVNNQYVGNCVEVDYHYVEPWLKKYEEKFNGHD